MLLDENMGTGLLYNAVLSHCLKSAVIIKFDWSAISPTADTGSNISHGAASQVLTNGLTLPLNLKQLDLLQCFQRRPFSVGPETQEWCEHSS